MPGDSVSVVMVAYGRGWEWVPRALDALHRNTAEPFEVILIDNGGWDAAERNVPNGCTVVRNDENIGFGPASNQGAELARGEVLCFLNPDVLVEPGWLSPLLEALSDEGVGAVFPAKLNLDGTLQDAGAFVTAEGFCYLVGDGADPASPEFRFPREVDYGSAACMCLRRVVFSETGGFDPIYRRAYFEDADLCFRLRSLGFRLAYAPRSRVRHVRTVSGSEAELRDVLMANHARFMQRWRDTVCRRPSLGDLQRDPAARLAARDLHASERILVLGDKAPAFARAFALEHPNARVTLPSKTIDSETAEDLLAAGIEVVPCDPDERWLVGRRGHYTAVVGRSDVSDTVRGWLDATQPQAMSWPLEGRGEQSAAT